MSGFWVNDNRYLEIDASPWASFLALETDVPGTDGRVHDRMVASRWRAVLRRSGWVAPSITDIRVVYPGRSEVQAWSCF